MHQVLEWVGNGIAISCINEDVYGICTHKKVTELVETNTCKFVMFANDTMVYEVIEVLEFLPQLIQLTPDAVARMAEKMDILTLEVKPIDIPRLLEFKENK